MHLLRSLFALPVLAACTASAPEPVTEDTSAPLSSDVVVLDRARIGSQPHEPNFQHARGPIAFPAQRVAKATLIVDLGTTCFPFRAWADDPPPAGQSYPPSCDAFDRSFEISLTDPADPAAPALELVHATTPFGGPLHMETDITDVANALAGAGRVLDTMISTYSDASGHVSGSNGGFDISARISYEAGAAPRDVIAVLPLHAGAVAGPSTTYDFTLPDGTTSTRIEYAATGHGTAVESDPKCLGGADEFCRRHHTLRVDDAEMASLDPWRDDCASLCTLVPGGPFGHSYCKENPTGNPNSVRAPRANWCPGSTTKPEEFEARLGPGPHTFGIDIDKIGAHGSWRVGLKVFAYR